MPKDDTKYNIVVDSGLKYIFHGDTKNSVCVVSYDGKDGGVNGKGKVCVTDLQNQPADDDTNEINKGEKTFFGTTLTVSTFCEGGEIRHIGIQRLIE